MKTIKKLLTSFLLHTLILSAIAISCKTSDNLNAPVSNIKLTEIQKSLEDPRAVEGNIRYFITDLNTELGLIARVPTFKVDLLIYGKKDSNGFLKEVSKALIYNPNTLGWVQTIYDKGYPTSIETSKGYLIELKNYNRLKTSVEITIKTKVDNKIINDNKTIILDAEFFQNVDAYNNYSSGRIAAIDNICNKNTERTVNAIGVAMNTFGCVTGIATIFATGGIALIPEGLGTILSCYGAVSGIYDAFTKGNVTEKYLGANGECAFKGAGIGYGVLFDCVRGTVGNNIEGIIKCTSHLIGSEADLYGCGCKEDPNKNAATSTGDPHITTFDGLYFDFQGYGEFIATKSTSDNFEVQIRQEDLHSSGKVTMNTAIAVQTGSDVVSIMMKPNRLFINNQAQNFASFTFQALKNGATINKIKIENYEVINISLKNGDLIKVNFHGSSFLDYSISPSINRKSKLIGILGNYDSDKLNDVQVRNGENILKDGKLPFGKLYSSYADSWRITNANSLFYYDSGKNTDSYTQKSFPPIEQNITAEQKFKAETICRNAGITTEPYLSNCIVDVAITNDLTLANSSLWGQNNNTFPANKPVPIVPEPIDLKKITITSKGTFLLKNDGTLWLSAEKNNNMFGIGNSLIEKPGYFFKIMDNIKDIASGSPDSHMLFLKNDNSVWATGENISGQLGNGGLLGINTPVKIMSDAKSMQIGFGLSFVVKNDNTLWAFGQILGMFGDKTKTNSNVPVKVLENVKSIFSNGINTLIIMNDNSLWGTAGGPGGQYLSNNSGQFGPTFSKNPPFKMAENVIFAAPQQFSNFYIKSDFSLWLAGQHIFFNNEKKTDFVKVMTDVKSIVTTFDNSSLILKTDNTLWAIGNNSSGQFGDGTTSIKSIPTKILDNVKSVYSYNGSTFVHKMDNSLWASGNNAFFSNNSGSGVLGIGILDKKIYNFVPVRID